MSGKNGVHVLGTGSHRAAKRLVSSGVNQQLARGHHVPVAPRPNLGLGQSLPLQRHQRHADVNGATVRSGIWTPDRNILTYAGSGKHIQRSKYACGSFTRTLPASIAYQTRVCHILTNSPSFNDRVNSQAKPRGRPVFHRGGSTFDALYLCWK